MLSFWYGRGREKNNKRQGLALWAEANRFRLHPAGCAVSQHPWGSLSIHLRRLLTAVFCMRLLLLCGFYLFEKKKKKCDYLALTLPLSTSKGCCWSFYLVPGTSVLRIRWKPFWQLFLYLCAYLGTKTLQKVKLCLCLHVQSSQLHTSLQNER